MPVAPLAEDVPQEELGVAGHRLVAPAGRLHVFFTLQLFYVSLYSGSGCCHLKKLRIPLRAGGGGGHKQLDMGQAIF